MKEIDVLIFVEHLNRELESAKLLKERILENNMTVEIKSTFHDMYDCMVNYKPKVIFVPWCYDNKDYHYFTRFELCKEHQPVIINLHHEQIINEQNKGFTLPSDKAKDVFHLSWGNDFTKKLKEIGCECNTIFQFGNPRFDFYKPELIKQSINKSQLSKEFKLNSDKKWILFIENFFLKDADEEYMERLQQKGVERKELEINKEKASIVYNTSLKWIEKFLVENKNIEFIYRLHPASLIKGYDEIIQIEKKFINFHVINKYPIRNWLINCDIVNQWNSTSVVEAVILKKAINVISPENCDLSSIPFMKDLNLTKNYEEFLEFNTNEDYLNCEMILEQAKEFYDLDEELTADRLALLAEDILQRYEKINSLMFKDFEFHSNYEEREKLAIVQNTLKDLFERNIICDEKDIDKIFALSQFLKYNQDYLKDID